MSESREQPIQDANQKDHPGGEKGESDQHGNKPNKDIPSIEVGRKVSPPPKMPETIKNPHEGKPEKPNWCDKGMFWLEAVMLLLELVGIIGLGIYCWLNWKEWRTFDSERQTMQDEFTASQTNTVAELEVLNGQLNEMRQTTELDERAWVWPQIEDNCIVPQGTNFVFNVFIKNTGKTAAVITGAIVRGAMDPEHIPARDQEMKGTTTVLSPNTSIKMPLPLPPIVISYTGTYPIYVYGTVWYNDIFGNKHWTQYCYSVTQTGTVVTPIYGVHGLTDDIDEIEKAQSHQ